METVGSIVPIIFWVVVIGGVIWLVSRAIKKRK